MGRYSCPLMNTCCIKRLNMNRSRGDFNLEGAYNAFWHALKEGARQLIKPKRETLRVTCNDALTELKFVGATYHIGLSVSLYAAAVFGETPEHRTAQSGARTRRERMEREVDRAVLLGISSGMTALSCLSARSVVARGEDIAHEHDHRERELPVIADRVYVPPMISVISYGTIKPRSLIK